MTDRIKSEHYGPGTPCSQCGEAIEDDAPEWTEYCDVHAEGRSAYGGNGGA